MRWMRCQERGRNDDRTENTFHSRLLRIRTAEQANFIEEMAELTVALNKAWRKTFDTVDKIPNMDDEERIEEEIADVEIMLLQIKYILGIGEDELSVIIERKLDRQIDRIISANYDGASDRRKDEPQAEKEA